VPEPVNAAGEHSDRFRDEGDTGHRPRFDEVPLNGDEAGRRAGLGLAVVLVPADGPNEAATLGWGGGVPFVGDTAVVLVFVLGDGTPGPAFAYEPEGQWGPRCNCSCEVHEVLLLGPGFGRERQRPCDISFVGDQQE
jgi:hypothetical protein